MTRLRLVLLLSLLATLPAPAAPVPSEPTLPWTAPAPTLPDTTALPAGALLRLGRSPVRIEVLAVSPDGRFFATVHDNAFISNVPRPIHLWDAHTGKHLRVLDGCHVGILSAAFSPDGKLLAAGGVDNVLHFFDVEKGKQLSSHGHNGHVYGISFSADGKRLLTGSNEVRLWDVARQREVRKFRPEGEGEFFFCSALSPDGKVAMTGGNKGLRFWDCDSGSVTRTLQVGPPGLMSLHRRFQFTPDGKALVGTALLTAPAEKWDVKTGTLLLQTGKGPGYRGQEVRAVFSPDATRIAWVDQKGGYDSPCATLAFAHLDGKLLRRIETPSPIASFAFTADGKRLVVGGQDGSLRVFDAASAKLRQTLLGPCSPIVAVRRLPGGKRLLTLHEDRTLRDWDLKTGKEQRSAALALPEGLDVFTRTADGKLLAAINRTFQLTVVDLDSGKSRFTANVPLSPVVNLGTRGFPGADVSVRRGRPLPPVAVAFSGDGRFIAGLTDRGGTITVWQTSDGKKVGSFKAPPRCSCLTMSHDGKTVVTASDSPENEDAIQFIDVATGRVTRTLKRPVPRPGPRQTIQVAERKIVLAPDGKLLATLEGTATTTYPPPGSRGRPSRSFSWRLKLWDVDNKVVVQQMDHLSGTPLVFSADGKLLAGGHNTGAWVLDIAARKVHRLEGHRAAVVVLQFAPDGKTLITGSEDVTAVIWNLAKRGP